MGTWDTKYPVNFTPTGDTTSQAIEKHINELSEIYTYLNRVRKFDAGTTAPTDPLVGHAWLDTSVSPHQLKVWDGSRWILIRSLAYPGFKNRIINGDFAVWQRGENFLYGTPPAWAAGTAYSVGDIVIPTTANGYYYECTVSGTSDATAEPTWPTTIGATVTDGTVTWECKGVQRITVEYNADRMKSVNTTDGYFIVIPGSMDNKKSMKVIVKSPPTDLTLSNCWRPINYVFEGSHLYDLASEGKSVTISFLFRSNVVGEYGISIVNNTGAVIYESYITTFNYTTANTIQKVAVTIPLDAAWTGAPQNDNNIGFYLSIATVNQGDYVTSSTNTWIVGDYRTTPTAVNWAAVAGNYIEIAQLQLEEGDVATEFEYVPFDVQLTRCMRYYEKSYNIDVVPGAATFDSAINVQLPTSGTGAIGTTVRFRVHKRTVPTITIFSPATGDSGVLYYNGVDYPASADFLGNGSFRCFFSDANVTKDSISFHFISDAEL